MRQVWWHRARVVLAVAASATALAVGGTLLPAAAEGAGHCHPGHPFPVIADGLAQVYLLDGQDIEGAPVRGCVYGHGLTVALGRTFQPPPDHNGPGVGNGDFALAGTMVAYEVAKARDDLYAVEQGQWHVVVRDLRTGRVVHDARSGVRDAPDPTEPAINEEPGKPPTVLPEESVGAGPLEAIALSPSGAVAWIAEDSNRNLRAHCGCFAQVHLLDSEGDEMLASGRGIGTALAIRAGRVYWAQQKRTRSAPLSGHVATSPAPHGSASRRCPPVSPDLLESDGAAQILGEPNPRANAWPRFGCAYGHAGLYELGDGPGLGSGFNSPAYVPQPSFGLAGVMAAYAVATGPTPEPGKDRVVVRNLADGRILRRIPGPGAHGVHLRDVGAPVRLLVTPGGDLAWLSLEVPQLDPEGPYRYVVGVADSHGARVVARGEIADGSLELVGHTVYWTSKNGGSRSVRLS